MAQPTEYGVDEDFSKHSARSSFKEPIVLMGIICLTLLDGINLTTISIRQQDYEPDRRIFFGVFYMVGPIPGTVGMAFISEITGRKPVFIALFSLSILSSVLSAIPYETVWFINSVIQGLISGGTLTMTFLAISEYCSPKHRFAYLVANAAAGMLAMETVLFIHVTKFLNTTSATFPVLAIILGLVCLASTWVWPESPYWLASKGKLVESKRVFLWLRGEQSETEFRTLKQEKRRPGPLRLYWLPLLIAIVTLSASESSTFQEFLGSSILYHGRNFISDDCKRIVSICSYIVICPILVLTSYKVKRKLLFTVASIVPLLVYYFLAVWFFLLDIPSNSKSFIWTFFINGILNKLGVIMLGMVVFIEIIPLKYNTHMTCVCFVFYRIINSCCIFMLYPSRLVSHEGINILLFTTLSLCGVILFYFLSREPKDKTLLEIQKSYAPKQDITGLEPATIPMQHVNERDVLAV